MDLVPMPAFLGLHLIMLGILLFSFLLLFYFLHNHYQLGTAYLVTGSEFKQGMPINLYELKYTNPPLTVIRIGLEEVMKKEPYHVINYNCQDYVNLASNNQRKSGEVLHRYVAESKRKRRQNRLK